MSLSDLTDEFKRFYKIKSVDPINVGFEDYAFKKSFCVDKTVHKKVLITGANSYIGNSFERWVKRYYPNIEATAIDMVNNNWHLRNFAEFDAVLHVAGIAHVDVEKVSESEKEKYYKVNTDLAIATAKKAKESGVKQFILMSSIIVYGDSATYGKEKVIDETTLPAPSNVYGDSKWKADVAVRRLADKKFKVAVLRAPMIYGRGSKGNYPILSKLAKKILFIPNIENFRSMIFIDNLCEFLSLLILCGEGGIFFPQNSEYTKTVYMIKSIAAYSGKKVHCISILNPFVRIVYKVFPKSSILINKAFGNLTYSQKLSVYQGLEYRIRSLDDSLRLTEFQPTNMNNGENRDSLEQYSVLMSVYCKDVPEYLLTAIESMLNQTMPCNQFVIVEDGLLTPGLTRVIDDYLNIHPELFLVVKLEKNVGLGKALDEGLKYCKYDLVARMDADDISKPERCEKLLKLFKNNPHLSLAGTNIDEFFDNPSNIISSRIVPQRYEDICKFIKRRSPFNHPTVMFRKSEVIRCGGYGQMRRKQDLDLFSRMLNGNCFALNIDESLLLFRSNQENYKRRKSWEYCKSYIDVERTNYKRGYCSWWDLMFVIIGQLTFFLIPESVMKFLSDHFLRRIYKVGGGRDGQNN